MGDTAGRILVVGTGAVGGYYGGRLAQAGNRVVFVARGANLDALRRRGLIVHSIGGDFTLSPVEAAESAAAVGHCALVLVCVKSTETLEAAEIARPVVTDDTIVLSLQNGVENEGLLSERLGAGHVLGGLAHIGAELVAPGEVLHTSGGRIIFGEFDGGVSPQARRLEQLFTAAGIDCRLSRNIALMLWDKLSWNAAFNALSAVTRSTVGELLRHSDGSELARRAMLEVVTVARAVGVPLDPARVDEAIERSRREMPDLRTSMLQDLERGKPLEYEALNGAVLRAAARAGVAVPVHRTLYALLSQLSPSKERD